MNFGIIIGWASPVHSTLTESSVNNGSDRLWIGNLVLDNDQFGWVSSLVNIGALFGALGAGFLLNKKVDVV